MRIAYLAQSYPPMISGASMFARQLAACHGRTWTSGVGDCRQ